MGTQSSLFVRKCLQLYYMAHTDLQRAPAEVSPLSHGVYFSSGSFSRHTSSLGSMSPSLLGLLPLCTQPVPTSCHTGKFRMMWNRDCAVASEQMFCHKGRELFQTICT